MEDSTTEHYEDFFKNIFESNALKTLEPYSLKIEYGDTLITLNNLYDFYTVYDLKLAIYSSERFKMTEAASPNNQLLFIKIGSQIRPLDFEWKAPLLFNPLIKQLAINPNFVSLDGDKRIVDIDIYDNLLLETLFKKFKISKDTVLQLTLYEDLIKENAYRSTKEYNGIVYPYYPFRELKTEHVKRLELFENKRNLVKKIETLLQRDVVFKENYPKFSTLKYLRFSWPKKTIADNLEELFYKIDVSERIPYLRLLGSSSVPISKIHLLDTKNNIPNISNPELLKVWSEEDNPLPGKDFVYGKIALNSTTLNIGIMYPTLRILADGSFDLTVQIPQNVKKFNPLKDCVNFSGQLSEGISILNRHNIRPLLSKADLTYGLTLPNNYPPVTRKTVHKRFPLFMSFFQEITPLPNETPTLNIRYKLVDNFVSEDNISSFLTQLTSKKTLIPIQQLAQLVSNEFELDSDTALKKVSDWFTKKNELQSILVGEKQEYIQYNNSGVDISIFEQHPFYTFHLYNVPSIEVLHRILTLLSLMFNADEKELYLKKIEQAQAIEETAQPRVVDIKEEETSYTDDDDELPDYLKEFPLEDHTLRVDDVIEKSESPQEELKDVVFTKKSEDVEHGIANFFIRKLKQADPDLFDYDIRDKSQSSYVSKCAANEMRQPAVLNREQFENMKDEYKRLPQDVGIYFHVYPLDPGVEDDISRFSDPDKTVTVLRYGSNPKIQGQTHVKDHYYLCSEYFCMRDEIVIFRDDFNGNRLRRPIIEDDGTESYAKDPKTCPFCRGELVRDRKHPGANETVLRRIEKPKSVKRHLWINFLKKSPHPNGLPLPCCFITPDTITYEKTVSGFEKKSNSKIDEILVAEDEGSDDEEYDLNMDDGAARIDYITTIQSFDTKYVVGEEKMPLDFADKTGPQIGLLPKELDTLFAQDSSKLVSRISNPQKITPDAVGFLRVGVDNRIRKRNDSFLAAIAPFYGRKSAKQMKKLLKDTITPRVFVGLNYGHLVSEFYNPASPGLSKEELRIWSTGSGVKEGELSIRYSNKNYLEVDRIYKSYTSFKAWLDSDSLKEYRHFAQTLAQSNLIAGANRVGLTLIVIDLAKDGNVSIRCPSYGYNSTLMDKNNVGFLLHTDDGIWEPIFHIDNTSKKPYTTLKANQYFNKAYINAWPDIVKKLWSDFKKLCNGPGVATYTSRSYIDSTSMIPLTEALKVIRNISIDNPKFHYVGILRDSYNGVAAVLIQEKRGEKEALVALPVVDDGVLCIDGELFFNWNTIPSLDSVENTIKIYENYISKYFPIYTDYKPLRVAIENGSDDIIALQLTNNLYIPVARTVLKPLGHYSEDPAIVKQFEWDIDTEILFGVNKADEKIEETITQEKTMNETYEHLRITFAGWLDRQGKKVKDLLMSDVIEYNTKNLDEKRRRLIVLLGPTVLSFFSTTAAKTPIVSLLRKDCSAIKLEESCTHMCVWNSDSSKCKIHAELSYKGVNLPNLLMLRLFDEILRYSIKRKQIFTNKISRLVFLDTPVYTGEDGDQYVVPENSLGWFELLRHSWTTKGFELSKHFEEISSTETTVRVKGDVRLQELPLELRAFLNPEDPKVSKLKYYEISKGSSLEPLMNYLGMRGVQEGATFSEKQLFNIMLVKKSSVAQVDLLTDTPPRPIIQYYPKSKDSMPFYIFVITPTGSGLLVKGTRPLPLNYEDVPDIFIRQ